MNSEFLVYLQLGWQHIVDLAGYDHILFVVALSIPYTYRSWRALAVLVTAFTLGHSLTLALATLRLVSVPSALVEALIPATIVATAALSWTRGAASVGAALVGSASDAPPGGSLRYAIAAGFGLIHGLGFSGYLRSLLGAEEQLVLPLLAFNVGLEIGQLLILSVVLVLGALLVPRLLSVTRWRQLLVVITGGLGVMLLVQRIGGG